jgi:hypothetical protein
MCSLCLPRCHSHPSWVSSRLLLSCYSEEIFAVGEKTLLSLLLRYMQVAMRDVVCSYDEFTDGCKTEAADRRGWQLCMVHDELLAWLRSRHDPVLDLPQIFKQTRLWAQTARKLFNTVTLVKFLKSGVYDLRMHPLKLFGVWLGQVLTFVACIAVAKLILFLFLLICDSVVLSIGSFILLSLGLSNKPRL